MITKMKKYTFLVFHKEYNDFLTALRNAGVLHIAERRAESEPNHDAETELHSLQERKSEVEHLLQQGASDELVQARQKVQHQLEALQKEAQEAAIWGDFDSQKIAALAEAGCALRFYSCRKEKFQEDWGMPVAEQSGSIYFVTTEVTEELQATASEYSLTKSPADYQQDLSNVRGLLAAADAHIEAWQKVNVDSLHAELQELDHKMQWQQVLLNTDHEADDKLCVLEGYCPIDKCEALNQLLDKQGAWYEATDPAADDDVPIQLHNNWFTRLFEVFTGMYGMPVYQEFDPTPVLAPFYLLFFSFCMGDAGYGLILILFGILTAKKKINIAMFEGLGPIITVLGIGTTVVGFFLGTFFGITLHDAAWYPECLKNCILYGNVAGFDIQMVAAIIIGVFHICLAMTIKAICYTKQSGFRNNLSTWGWVLLIVGGLILGIVAMLLKLPTEVTEYALIGIGAVSALGIFIFNKPGRNPLINIGAGLWDTYGMATGLLGDVLSYVRLYALGLAGGMLGGAFNTIANMVLGTNPTWQWLPFVLILLLGHVLNVLMSALGAFVHPLRLTFVEYFKNVGYEGKGTAYKPFKVNQ